MILLDIKKQTSTHYTSKRFSKLGYLFIHYTGGVSSAKGSAISTAKYFAHAPRAASADFIVDDVDIVQYNPDIIGRYCYAVGGKGNPKKYDMSTHLGGKLYGKANNRNSISIEMCSNKKNRKSLSDNDKDWYLTEATINNAAKLAAYLLKKYNIPFSNMRMHHEVSYYGKLCPLPFCQKESDLAKWEDFKRRVKSYMKGEEPKKSKPKNLASKDAIKGESNKDRFIRTFGYWCNQDLGTDFENKVQLNKLKDVVSKHNLVKGCKYKGMVRHLQYWLNKLMDSKLDVDGDFGNKTEEAVKKLQKKIGTEQDGKFGSGTLTKMIDKMF